VPVTISVKLDCLKLKYIMWALLTKVETTVITIIIWNRVIGRLAVPHLPTVQPEFSTHPATELCPEPAESISRPHTIFKVYLNVIIPSTYAYPKWLHPIRNFWLKFCKKFLFLSCVLIVTLTLIFLTGLPQCFLRLHITVLFFCRILSSHFGSSLT